MFTPRISWWLLTAFFISLLYYHVNANETDLATTTGDCYYNYNHYSEGDRILTNEPCLNCTCHNKMLMCYLKVCPFTKPIGQDCTIEKRDDQCCPIITCPEVPVELDQSVTQTTTDLATHQQYGCSIDDRFYPEGAQIPGNPKKPCELCYCIRNMTSCVMQECTLHVDGCRPIYNKGVCCPVRYDCAHEEEIELIEDSQTTTERPSQGFVITTTSAPSECIHDNIRYNDGEIINTNQPCEHCYCMRGDIVCAVQDCGRPLEMHGKNCTAHPSKDGECCPQIYECESDADAGGFTQFESSPTTTTATDEAFDATTQRFVDSPAIQQHDEDSNTERVSDDSTERIDESENEIHDKDYDHITLKPTRNNSQQASAVDDRIADEEATTILNKLSEITTSNILSVSEMANDKIFNDLPAIALDQITTEKANADEDLDELATTESKSISRDDVTTIKSITESNTLSEHDKIEEVPHVSGEADGSFLSNMIPGEGDCLEGGITYSNNTDVPVRQKCELSCVCYNSIVRCERIHCALNLPKGQDCKIIHNADECCPSYSCKNIEEITDEPTTEGSGSDQKVDEFAESTTLEQRIESETQTASSAEESFTKPSFVSLNAPISSKLDDKLEIIPEISTESDFVEHETIQPHDASVSPGHDELFKEQMPSVSTEAEQMPSVSTEAEQIPTEKEQESTTVYDANVGEQEQESATTESAPSIHSESPQIADELAVESEIPQTTSHYSSAGPVDMEKEQAFESDIETTTFTEFESKPIHPLTETPSPVSFEEITTQKSAQNDATTLEPQEKDNITTEKSETVPKLESFESNAKLPIETAFEQLTTEKQFEAETTTVYVEEAPVKHEETPMEQEQVPVQMAFPSTGSEEVANSTPSKEVGSEDFEKENDAVSTVQPSLSPEDKLIPSTASPIYSDEEVSSTTSTEHNDVITEKQNEPHVSIEETKPSPNSEENVDAEPEMSTKFSTSVSEQQDEHTPPPVAIERDESITESYDQKLPVAHEQPAPTSTSSAEIPVEQITEKMDQQSSVTSTEYSGEQIATTEASSKLELGGIDSNDFKEGDVIRPDEKQEMDLDEGDKSITTEQTDKMISSSNQPEATTEQKEYQHPTTETPTSAPSKHDEYLHPEFDAESTTLLNIPSKQEDLDIITEKIVPSKQEDLEIVTSAQSEGENTTPSKAYSEAITTTSPEMKEEAYTTTSAPVKKEEEYATTPETYSESITTSAPIVKEEEHIRTSEVYSEASSTLSPKIKEEEYVTASVEQTTQFAEDDEAFVSEITTEKEAAKPVLPYSGVESEENIMPSFESSPTTEAEGQELESSSAVPQHDEYSIADETTDSAKVSEPTKHAEIATTEKPQEQNEYESTSESEASPSTESTYQQSSGIEDKFGEPEVQSGEFTTGATETSQQSTESVHRATEYPSGSSTESGAVDITTLLNKIHEGSNDIDSTTSYDVVSEITTAKQEQEPILTHSDESLDQKINVVEEEVTTEANVSLDEKEEKTTQAAQVTQTTQYEEMSPSTHAPSERLPVEYEDAHEIESTSQQKFESSESEGTTTVSAIQHEKAPIPFEYSTSEPILDEQTTIKQTHEEVPLAGNQPSFNLNTEPIVSTSAPAENENEMTESQTHAVPAESSTEKENYVTESAPVPEMITERVEESNEPTKFSDEPLVAENDKQPEEAAPIENMEGQFSTEPTILDVTTIRNVVELLTTLHNIPEAEAEAEAATTHSSDIESSSHPSYITPIYNRIDVHETTTGHALIPSDHNIDSESAIYEDSDPAVTANGTQQNIPPESANNIPLIRDPSPDQFNEITTKLAANFDITTLPSTLSSHIEQTSDSTTVKNTQNEIIEQSSHISEGSLPNETESEHELESQPQAPSYGQPQAPSYEQSGYGSVPSQYPDEEYTDEDEPTVFGPGTCRYGGKLYVSAQQIPRDDPCDFCFCFRSDIICLQQSCPPPINGCHEEPISGFCCPRYECPVSMALNINATTTTTTTLPPYLSHFQRNSSKVTRSGCLVQGITYKIGERVTTASGPCIDCICGGDGQMKCDPKVCTPEPMLRQMIAVASTRR